MLPHKGGGMRHFGGGEKTRDLSLAPQKLHGALRGAEEENQMVRHDCIAQSQAYGMHLLKEDFC